jgi:hypothetical protein
MQSEYIEIPRRTAIPTKIDLILQQRMHAFMRARRVRRFTFFTEK